MTSKYSVSADYCGQYNGIINMPLDRNLPNLIVFSENNVS